ncbi:Uncharacterised protein [Mycobacteroides abscessus]|nr:Uncharacterised protein [Mycobacteroides abscessus]
MPDGGRRHRGRRHLGCARARGVGGHAGGRLRCGGHASMMAIFGLAVLRVAEQPVRGAPDRGCGRPQPRPRAGPPSAPHAGPGARRRGWIGA